MRTLLIHADTFEYEAKEPAIKNPEEIADTERRDAMKEVLVAFCTVEKEDEKNPILIAERATDAIAEVADWVKAKNIMVYPYAHLSSSLADRDTAIPVLKSVQQALLKKGYNARRGPFGWYKSFDLHCKGHPLSELSRSIATTEEEKRAEGQVQTTYMVMDIEGKLFTPEEYMSRPGHREFRTLVEKEALRRELPGGKPTFLDYCRKFGIEWESYSDIGHMRYGPEATAMFELVSEYAWEVANSLGIPVFSIRGTNMFDLSKKAVKEHADLFGARLYEVKVEEKNLVLRYAACHQQFATVKDWRLSYRHLPFGTFETADSYRLEQSGELLLCFRVRKLHMPDLHVYCKGIEEAKEMSMRIHERIYKEIRDIGRDYVSIYNTTRTFFEQNKSFFIELAKVEAKPVLLNFVPEGIFYWVINVEYTIIDQLGRPREIATFQIDVGNAERFGISYADSQGNKHYPPIIHTALIGTVERYLFTLLDTAAIAEREKRKPMLPIWISPVQVRLIPVAKHHMKLALRVARKLRSRRLRVDIDDREETVAKRIRDAEVLWVPYVIVLGEKELRKKIVVVRMRDRATQKNMAIAELIKEVEGKIRGFPTQPLKVPELVSQRPIYAGV